MVSSLYMCERVLPELLYVFHIFVTALYLIECIMYTHVYLFIWPQFYAQKNPINKEKHVLAI